MSHGWKDRGGMVKDLEHRTSRQRSTHKPGFTENPPQLVTYCREPEHWQQEQGRELLQQPLEGPIRSFLASTVLASTHVFTTWLVFPPLYPTPPHSNLLLCVFLATRLAKAHRAAPQPCRASAGEQHPEGFACFTSGLRSSLDVS